MRFPGFEDEWEKTKLGDMADVTKLAGFEFTKYVEYEDEGNIIAIRAINIKNDSLDLSDVKYIDNSDFSKLNRSKLFKGDLLFTYVGANIGDNCLIEENDKFYLAPNVCRIRTKEGNHPFFIKQLFETISIDKEINKYINRTSQPTITMENMRNFRIIKPLEDEQKKISDFLLCIDKKIALMEKKYIYYRKFLNVLLKKIFNKYNNTHEQLRFKDICTFKGGYSFKEKYQGHTNLPIPFYKVSDLNLNQKYMEKVNNTVDMDFVHDMKYNLIDRKSVLIAKLGEAVFLERKRITTKPCLIDNNLLSCTPIDDNNLDLLYYLMLNTNISRFAQQTAVPSLSPKDIGDIKVFVPKNNIERRNSINLLKSVDKKIENINKEIELNKEFKRSLLSKMFC